MFDVSLFHTFYSQHIFPAGTAAQRKRRQVDRNDRIHFSNNIRAFYAGNITGNDVVDDELVGGLRVKAMLFIHQRSKGPRAFSL